MRQLHDTGTACVGMGRKWAFSVGDEAREEGNSNSKTHVKNKKEAQGHPKGEHG